MQAELELNAPEQRDAGIAQVIAHNEEWSVRAKKYVASLKGWTGTGEDLRMLVTQVVGEPKHHNAWGGLVMGCVKARYIFGTGKYRKMLGGKSHARKTQIYSTGDKPVAISPDIKAAARRAYEARAKHDIENVRGSTKWPKYDDQPAIVHNLYESIARAVLGIN